MKWTPLNRSLFNFVFSTQDLKVLNFVWNWTKQFLSESDYFNVKKLKLDLDSTSPSFSWWRKIHCTSPSPAFHGGGRPKEPFAALFKSQAATKVETPTFHNLFSHCTSFNYKFSYMCTGLISNKSPTVKNHLIITTCKPSSHSVNKY